MIPDDLVPIITKLTCQQLEQVTCIECCKYYIAPETATCGHTLCHGCWIGRHTCPLCASSVDRRALRFNKPMQELTEHIHALCDTFETLFNVQLDDLMNDVIQSNSDPTRNVKDWLASSQNQFSAPALSFQLPTQDLVQQSTSKIQIHTHTKKSECPPKVVCAPQYQEDWDKIEVLPDTEDMSKNAKKKQNVVDPMDLDPFFYDENEYTTDNPRRSSRKKDLKNESYPNPQIPSASADKHSSKNSSADADKKSLKVKQNWSNVKKMRKEFSKLNKNSRSKLNVSIEMCKKAQNTVKPKPVTPLAAPQQAAYVIDDNTPHIDDVEDKEREVSENDSPNTKDNDTPASNVNVSKITNNCKSININEPLQLSNNSMSTFNFKVLSKEKSNNDIITSQNYIQKEFADNLMNLENVSSSVNNKSLQADQPKINNSSNVTRDKETAKNNNNNIPFTKRSAFSYGSNTTNEKEIVKNNNNTPFLKKSVLHQKNTEHHCVEIVQKEIETQTANTSDIEISIKVGNSITNIFIKEKREEVQLKVNTDREIQTSLGPYNLPDKQTHNLPGKQDVSCSPFKGVNLQLNIDGNKVGNATPVNKSVSTKKNTDSADTATANFEITDSVERQISDVMDCIEINNAAIIQVQNIPQVSKTQRIIPKSLQSKDIMVTEMNEIEELNDIDIFESDSVKEANVQFIKNTTPAPSEILMPTMKNRSTQKIRDKRDRDVNDEADMPNNKKQKIDENKTNPAVLLDVTEPDNNIDNANDSESMSYDKIMGPIFKNIDADIKSQNTVKNTQKTNKPDNCTMQSQSSQIIHKTQKNKSKQIRKDVHVTLKTQEHIHEKYSENIFSTIEKDCEAHSETVKDISQHPATKSALELSCNKNTDPDIIMDVEHILGTPIADHYDSDKSVVEETPQKNISFTKLKMKPDATNKINNTQKQQIMSNENPTAELRKQQSDSEIIKSIIDISDTSEDTIKRKDTTVVETVKKISNLETPLTIKKFVNHIKHNSTPVARKSLNFEAENTEDPEQTLCPTTTQEKEFLTKAFEQSPKSPIKRPLGLNNFKSKEIKKLYIAGSCLIPAELVNVKLLCHSQGWTYVDKYTQDLTHLVVGVDEENKSQRSVKYMCALAASKWIVSYKWVEKCLKVKDYVDELPYEVLDACGDPGPRRSRVAQRKLFQGIKFYCMPPFSVLDVDTLKYILEAAGGCVVEGAEGVRVTADGSPALLLAEPEHTQDDKFMYLAIKLNVVPVNYEWVLNCLGTHSLGSLHEHLLYPSSLLPKATRQWPHSLFAYDSIDNGDDL